MKNKFDAKRKNFFLEINHLGIKPQSMGRHGICLENNHQSGATLIMVSVIIASFTLFVGGLGMLISSYSNSNTAFTDLSRDFYLMDAGIGVGLQKWFHENEPRDDKSTFEVSFFGQPHKLDALITLVATDEIGLTGTRKKIDIIAETLGTGPKRRTDLTIHSKIIPVLEESIVPFAGTFSGCDLLEQRKGYGFNGGFLIGATENGLDIYDCRDGFSSLLSPPYSSFSLAGAKGLDTIVLGNHAIVTDSSGDIQKIDLSDPKNPVLAQGNNKVQSGEFLSGTGINPEPWGLLVAQMGEEDWILVALGSYGIYRIAAQDFTPDLAWHIDIGDAQAYAMDLWGDNLEIAGGSGGILRYNLENGDLADMPLPFGTALGIKIIDNIAYIAGGEGGFMALNLLDSAFLPVPYVSNAVNLVLFWDKMLVNSPDCTTVLDRKTQFFWARK